MEQRTPIMRIKSEQADYYMDAEGVRIPVSGNYTARVLVVTGHVTEQFARNELIPFVQYITNDEFWNAQIRQLYVQRNNEVVFVPTIGDHLVELGTVEGFEQKLRNLNAVYRDGFRQTGWDKYKTLNLRYRNQVVCIKR